MRPKTRLLASAAALAFACGCTAAREPDATASADEADEAAAPGRVVLSPSAFEAADVRMEEVRASTGPTALEVSAVVTFDSARIAVVSPRAAGRLETMVAVPGDAVGRQDSVAFVSSPTYLTAQTDVIQAARRVALLTGGPEEADARAVLEASRRRLALLGTSEQEVHRLEAGSEPSLLLPLRPPFDGTVLDALAQPGIAVEPGTPVFRIADLRRMHAVALVPEEAVARVREGAKATLALRAYPGRTFEGVVDRILDRLDPETRTARVIIRVPNPARRLKEGMFGTVQIEVSDSGQPATRPTITIPTSAVLTDGERRFVFVEVGARTFERRDVEVAPSLPAAARTDRLAVTEGLSEGERVVVAGALVLRSELGKGNLVDDDG